MPQGKQRVATIFEGLAPEQVDALNEGKCNLHVHAGETLFREGDAAFGLFIIDRGAVEVIHGTGPDAAVIARLEPPAVFGEMGLIMDVGLRTATVRAVEDSLLVVIPGDPGDMFTQIKDSDTAIRLLQNLICLLGDRLRSASVITARGGAIPVLISELEGRSAASALHVVEKYLETSGFLSRLKPRKNLSPGKYLFRQGDESTDFYLIHTGVLDVLDETRDQDQVLTRMHAPNVVGEVGFFSGRARIASCRVVERIEYTHFSGSDYQRLRRRDPRMAFDVVFAAAQLTVQLIVERQKHLYSDR